MNGVTQKYAQISFVQHKSALRPRCSVCLVCYTVSVSLGLFIAKLKEAKLMVMAMESHLVHLECLHLNISTWENIFNVLLHFLLQLGPISTYTFVFQAKKSMINFFVILNLDLTSPESTSNAN